MHASTRSSTLERHLPLCLLEDLEAAEAEVGVGVAADQLAGSQLATSPCRREDLDRRLVANVNAVTMRPAALRFLDAVDEDACKVMARRVITDVDDARDGAREDVPGCA